MSREILSVPEDHLAEVIKVIRAGLKVTRGISRETREQLKKWCDKEEEYIRRLQEP